MLNKKGTMCPFKPILCQEGYCKDCQVYSDWQGYQRTMGGEPQKDAIGEIRKLRDEAFNESLFGSEGHQNRQQAMVNAYDTVLKILVGR